MYVCVYMYVYRIKCIYIYVYIIYVYMYMYILYVYRIKLCKNYFTCSINRFMQDKCRHKQLANLYCHNCSIIVFFDADI